MGMPLYGQSFTLADSKNNGLNARAPGPGQAGEATRAAGFLAYYEVNALNLSVRFKQSIERPFKPFRFATAFVTEAGK